MPAQAILCPNLVELPVLFSDDADERRPKTALLLLHKMRLRTTEDIFASYPKLFDTPPDADEYKRLSAGMRAAGAATETRSADRQQFSITLLIR